MMMLMLLGILAMTRHAPDSPRPRPAPFQAEPLLSKVFIAISHDGSLPTTRNPDPLPWDTPVTLYAVAYTPAGGGTYFCGDADAPATFPVRALIDGREVALHRWQSAQGWAKLNFEWRTIQPNTDAQYTGVQYLPKKFPRTARMWQDPDDGYSWKRQGITPLYQELPLHGPEAGAWKTDLNWLMPANRMPKSMPVQYANVMRYRVKVSFAHQGRNSALLTPGSDTITKGYGIANAVTRVAWRRPYASDIPSNEQLLQYAGANAGCACIYGGTDVQAEHFIGMDCSHLFISAWRKFGNHRDPYTNAQGLYNRAVKGRYQMVLNGVPASRVPRRLVHVGDILLLKSAGSKGYEHSFFYLGGGTGAYINTTDGEYSVHFNQWDTRGTNYRVAGNTIKFDWVGYSNDTISVIRLK